MKKDVAPTILLIIGFCLCIMSVLSWQMTWYINPWIGTIGLFFGLVLIFLSLIFSFIIKIINGILEIITNLFPSRKI